jgi:hypothetical protein
MRAVADINHHFYKHSNLYSYADLDEDLDADDNEYA